MKDYDTELARWKEAVHNIKGPDLKANVMKGLAKEKIKRSPGKQVAAYGAAILAVLFLVSGTVMAVGGITFEELIAKLQSPFAEKLQPVSAVCEDQGIRVEMIALGYDEQMAQFYITVKDMKGERIDENTRFSVYSLSSQDGGGLGLVDYDAKKGIATYEIAAHSKDGFDGKTIAFKGSELAYHMREWTECPIDTDLVRTDGNPTTLTLSLYNAMFVAADLELFDENKQARILKPNQKNLDFPEISFARLTGLGIVDGELHVQFRQDPDLCDYDYARPYLKKLNGDGTFSKSIEDPETLMYEDRVYPAKTAYFYTDVNGDFVPFENGILTEKSDQYHIEYVFDINTDDLDQYGLFADFRKYDLLQGQWTLEIRQEKADSSH